MKNNNSKSTKISPPGDKKRSRGDDRQRNAPRDQSASGSEERKEIGKEEPYYAPGRRPDRDEDDPRNPPAGGYAHNDNYGKKPGSIFNDREAGDRNSMDGKSLREDRGRPKLESGEREKKDRGHYDDREY